MAKKNYTVNVHYDAVLTIPNVVAENEHEAREIAKRMASNISLEDAEIMGCDACVTDEKEVTE